jgi:P-type conjugative transfer protein TrbL
MMTLDPSSVNFIQHYFLQGLGTHYQTVIGYANDLLYIFATLEIVFFGLMWALKQNAGFDRLFLKGFKICFIFFLVTHFPYLCNLIIESFAKIGGTVSATNNFADIIFNPAILWQYGYDPGISLLKMATQSYGFGLPLLELVLGLSILLTFALFIIQIILQVLGFYFVSLTALICLPVGVFSPSTNMLSQALTHVLKAGVRVMVIVIIADIAAGIWNSYGVITVTQDTNLTPILGLLFSGILFLCLAKYAPKITTGTVGRIFTPKSSNQQQTTVSISPHTSASKSVDFSSAPVASSETNTTIAAASAATLFSGTTSSATIAIAPSSHQNTPPLSITPKALRHQMINRSTREMVQLEKKPVLILSEKQFDDIKKALLDTLAKKSHHVKNTKNTHKEFDDENWRTSS